MLLAAIDIKMPIKEKERLADLALQYGFSIPELSRRILASFISQVGRESFSDYENPEQLKASFGRAVNDFNTGQISTEL